MFTGEGKKRKKNDENFVAIFLNELLVTGQNGQIPHFLEIFNKKTLFRK